MAIWDRNVVVWIDGGPTFPWVTDVTFVPYRRGMTVYDALSQAGVEFIGTQIILVNGIPIGGAWDATITLNGRPIPSRAIGIRLEPFDQLIVSIVPVPTLY